MLRVPTALSRLLTTVIFGLLLVPLLLGLAVPAAGATATGTARAALPSASTAGPLFPVRFMETGLPTGSNWTVTLGGNSSSSTGSLIVFYVANGTYNYSIGSTNGYVPSVPSGSLVVQGGNNSVVATVNVPAAKPWGGVWDPLTGSVVMSYEAKGNLSVINGTTNSNSGSITVGKSPYAPVYDPVHQYLYVPNWGSNNVTILNATTYAHVADVLVGHAPIQGVFDPVNGLVYVANDQGNSVSVLNGANATPLATIGVGNAPEGITFNPIDGSIYVVNSATDNVSVISGTPGTVLATVPLPMNTGPRGIAFDSANGELYVTETGPAACPGGGAPCRGAVINATTDAFSGTFLEGTNAYYPAFDSGNGYVYVANALNPGTVTAISSVPNAAVSTITVGSTPFTLTVDPANGCIYSANNAANTISVIDGTIVTEAVAFVPRPPTLYPVDFTESGLTNGTSWSVVVNGTQYGSGASSIMLTEASGTYPFAVVSVSGYTVSPSGGSFTVNGSGQNLTVAFQSSVAGGASAILSHGGFFGYYGDALVVAVILAVVVTLLLAVLVRRRRRSGATMASIAAEAGLPLSIAESAAPPPPPPEERTPPPPDLPPAIRIHDEPPPKKSAWDEQ